MYDFGKRVGWLSGDKLRELEAEWLEDGREAREMEADRIKTMAMFKRLNVFNFGSANKTEELKKANDASEAAADRLWKAKSEKKTREG